MIKNKKQLFLCIAFGFIVALLNAQEIGSVIKDLTKDTANVSIPFHSGLDDYHSFRIPAVIKTKNALIAFAEGRKNSTSDFGDIDLVCRRSLDEGKTWGALKLLYDQDTLAVQNPVPIYVASENKIVLLFNTTALSEHDILNKEYDLAHERKAFMTSSIDNGITWTTPRDITKQVKKMHWRWHALGPVHGIELKFGKDKGRLVAPVAISIEKGSKAYCMTLIYSDDKGETWQIGAVDKDVADTVQANETTIVELIDGRIYVNTRDQNGGSLEKNRGETYSLDGGLTFSSTILESDKFPSPIVQSALLRWSGGIANEKSILLFATPSHVDKRLDLIVMASYDESENWNTLFKIHDGSSAYSDMVKLNDKTLGVIYETDDYKNIRFRRVPMKN